MWSWFYSGLNSWIKELTVTVFVLMSSLIKRMLQFCLGSKADLDPADFEIYVNTGSQWNSITQMLTLNIHLNNNKQRPCVWFRSNRPDTVNLSLSSRSDSHTGERWDCLCSWTQQTLTPADVFPTAQPSARQISSTAPPANLHAESGGTGSPLWGARWDLTPLVLVRWDQWSKLTDGTAAPRAGDRSVVLVSNRTREAIGNARHSRPRPPSHIRNLRTQGRQELHPAVFTRQIFPASESGCCGHHQHPSGAWIVHS